MKEAQNNGAPRRRRLLLLWILLAVIAVAAAATAIYAADYSRAEPLVRELLEAGTPGVRVEESAKRLVFLPEDARAGLVFYPGGKVEFTAYVPLMLRLAQRGILCVLPKMPLNLAVLAPGTAEGIPAQYPSVGFWMIGGHSLGGAMAASYAAGHTDGWQALVLLAAYSTADLSGSGLKVLSIFGTQDGVLNRKKYEKYRLNLPEDLTEIVIEGGCHAFFGAYGAQKGDGEPTIAREEQWERTAEAIAELAGLKAP